MNVVKKFAYALEEVAPFLCSTIGVLAVFITHGLFAGMDSSVTSFARATSSIPVVVYVIALFSMGAYSHTYKRVMGERSQSNVFEVILGKEIDHNYAMTVLVLASVIGTLILTGVAYAPIAFTFSLIAVTGLFLTYEAIVWIARKVVQLNKALNTHVNDTSIHNRGE